MNEGMWQIHATLGGFLGYSGLSGTGLSSSTSMTQLGGDVTLAVRIDDAFLFGITSDYRNIGQLSSIDSHVGNFTGTRFTPVSPTIGLRTRKYFLEIDYQFLGDFSLSNKTAGGASISYAHPQGIRIRVAHQFYHSIYAGLQYETVSFTTQKSSQNGDISLSPSLSLWQAGINIMLVY